MDDAAYTGTELDLFARARRWKAYWASHVSPCLRGDVLEVGAGLGANTVVLLNRGVTRWVCLEPDRRMAVSLSQRFQQRPADDRVEILAGTMSALEVGALFDAILYLDVLEHIRDDVGEVARALAHLRPGGALVVLAPAHPWLWSPFDEAIGHHRRYTKASLDAVMPNELRRERLIYLDSIGLLASGANRILLRRGAPTRAQLWVWDALMVPCSAIFDSTLGYAVGKSVLGIWRRRT